MKAFNRLPWGSILVGLVVVVLVWQLGKAIVLYVKHNGSAIRFEHPVDYGEGPLLDQAVRLARFENIYRNDLRYPPYTISNYPPLYILVQVPFVWLFGPALWYGRLISTLSMAAAAIFIGLILDSVTKDRLAGVFGGAILLVFPYVIYWSALNRIDSLALALSFAGLYVVARQPKNRKTIIVGGILLSLAVFTRQSYALAAPLAAFIWLLREPPRRVAWEFGLSMACICLGLFLLLQVATDGGFFLNTVTANVNPFSWEPVKHYCGVIAQYVWPLIAVSIVVVAFGQGFRHAIMWLVVPYSIGAILSGLTIGKEGSNVNYLLELCAAFSLLAGSLIACIRTNSVWRATLLLVLAFQVHVLAQWSESNASPSVYGRIAEGKALSGLKLLIDNARGPVLVDEHMAMVPLAGKSLAYQPFEFKMLSDSRVWDQQPFLRSIWNREFALILLYDPPHWNSIDSRWTGEQLQAIQLSYRYSGRLANMVVLVPN